MTKIVHIEARYSKPLNIDKNEIKKLPNSIGIVGTVQFVSHLKRLKSQLKGKKVILSKGRQEYHGQILGCDVSCAEKIKDKVDAFLYIGTGHFHPIALGLMELDVFILNPETGRINKLDKKKVAVYKKRKKGALIKFYSADSIGVIISSKIGQEYSLKNLNFLEKKYKNKRFYYFVADNVNTSEFLNFPFIGAWVNTACVRLEDDATLLNVSDV